jgi:hypothetical protein
MTLPRCAADVLADHVLFEIEAIDRMYLNLYQPRLQHGAGIAAFFVGHRGHRFASSALMAPMTAAFTADIDHFIAARGLDLVRFARGQRKDDVTREYLRRAECDDRGLVPAQVLYVGVAQEKQRVFRTSKRRNPVTGATYPWLVPGSGVVNQYYFYCVDEEFGPVCVKFSGYFPYTGRLILNGNEYAKRQAAKAGIGFVPLDNAFAAVDDVAAVQAICDALDEGTITALAARLLAMLPYPFTAEDTAAGYRYELSVLQAEFSLTQMLDAPVTGRIFFDQLIRDNLDLGRPDRVTLIFGRKIIRKGKRATPGRFRTRVITEDVTPSLHVDYKHSKIKQYHKLGKALRTETTINDTADFGVAKGLSHLPELKEIGFTASRRLLDVQRISHDPAEGTATMTALTQPVISPAGTPHRRDAHPQPPRAGAPRRLVRVPAAAPRFHQPRPAHSPRAPAGAHSRGHDQRADQLRPATAPHPRAHPAHPAQLPLSGHPRRHPAGNVPDPPDPAAAHHRPGRACPARSSRALPAPRRRPRLRHSNRRPRPAVTPRRLAPAPSAGTNHSSQPNLTHQFHDHPVKPSSVLRQ